MHSKAALRKSRPSSTVCLNGPRSTYKAAVSRKSRQTSVWGKCDGRSGDLVDKLGTLCGLFVEQWQQNGQQLADCKGLIVREAVEGKQRAPTHLPNSGEWHECPWETYMEHERFATTDTLRSSSSSSCRKLGRAACNAGGSGLLPSSIVAVRS